MYMHESTPIPCTLYFCNADSHSSTTVCCLINTVRLLGSLLYCVEFLSMNHLPLPSTAYYNSLSTQ